MAVRNVQIVAAGRIAETEAVMRRQLRQIQNRRSLLPQTHLPLRNLIKSVQAVDVDVVAVAVEMEDERKTLQCQNIVRSLSRRQHLSKARP